MGKGALVVYWFRNFERSKEISLIIHKASKKRECFRERKMHAIPEGCFLEMMNFVDYVNKYALIRETRCYRHCENVARVSFLFESGDSLIGAYVCPGGYVSRVTYFSKVPNRDWFKQFLREQVGEARVRDKDIRAATRYGWELGTDAEKEIQSLAPNNTGIKQLYWVLYPKDDEDRKYGTFQCSKEQGGCGRLFTKLISSNEKLCPDCSGRGKKEKNE